MHNKTLHASLIAAFILGAFTSAPTLAEKPDWAGGKHEQRDRDQAERRGDPRKSDQRYERSGDRPRQESRRDDRRDDRRDRDDRDDRRARDGGRHTTVVIHHFDDHRRSTARDYYHRHYSSGRCPPGLAKKHNGCVPPGLARKWSRGRPLPREVIYYDLPPALVIELGAPPPRHRYVRVASDILLIAIGTGIVVDAIEDLSWR